MCPTSDPHEQKRTLFQFGKVDDGTRGCGYASRATRVLRVRPRWRLQPLDDQFQPVED
jgi:hypothetical protein